MKIFICEENEKYIIGLIKKIKSLPCHEDIKFESYTQIPDITHRLETEIFDIAFLGAEIDGESGFGLGSLLKEKQPDCIIFYVGKDYTYMHEVFRAEGFQFLLRTQNDLLDSEFPRAYEIYRKTCFEICFHPNYYRDMNLIPGEIIYIETTHNKIFVVTRLGKYCGYFDDFKKMKRELMEYHFFQMHPHYFVNMEHIEMFKKGELILDNGDCIPTSAMNRDVIEETIQAFIERY